MKRLVYLFGVIALLMALALPLSQRVGSVWADDPNATAVGVMTEDEDTGAPTEAVTADDTGEEADGEDTNIVDATEDSAAYADDALTSTSCRDGEPLANVYHPDRLQVVNPCMSVSGTVQVTRKEEDGDVHINLTLDDAYANLINEKNITGEHGALVLEIVPADAPGCTIGEAPKPARGTYDYGTCSGAAIAAPRVGQHITVTGPYVLDQEHGWMEIHPVWAWQEDDSSTEGEDALAPAEYESSESDSTGSTVSTDTTPSTGGHTFYLSTYRTAHEYYCDDDPAWQELSHRYLVQLPSEEAVLEQFPGRTLHRPCR